MGGLISRAMGPIQARFGDRLMAFVAGPYRKSSLVMREEEREMFL